MSDSNSPYTQELSPLDLLEQRSRMLASRLNENETGITNNIGIKPTINRDRSHELSGIIAEPPSLKSSSNYTFAVHGSQHLQHDQTTSVDVFSPSRRNGSTTSSSSLSSILGSFRLSSLPRANGRAEDIREEVSSIPAFTSTPKPLKADNDQSLYDTSAKRENPINISSRLATDFKKDDSPLQQGNIQALKGEVSATISSDISNGQEHRAIDSRQESLNATEQSLAKNVNPAKLKNRSIAQPSRNSNYFFSEPKSVRSRLNEIDPYIHQGLSGTKNNKLLTPPKLSQGGALSPGRIERHTHSKSEICLLSEVSLDDHVALGIRFHEQGNLRESSYHWQYAAFKGDTTAMLLYGLALRHGWGIRKNPTEAVTWLKNATANAISHNTLINELDSNSALSSILGEIIPGERSSEESGGHISNLKKAHVALAFYELGMTYLNSWGAEKDEHLALQCFELGGMLGDPDALCEAAALWMHNGPKGRKKDLKRAAKLYRLAGEKGASMVGNNWIYKEKYMEDDLVPDAKNDKDRKDAKNGALVSESQDSTDKRKFIFSKRK